MSGAAVAPRLELRVVGAADIDRAATVDVVNAAFRVYPFLTEARTSLDGIADEMWPGCRFLQVSDGGELVASATITPGATAPADEEHFPGIDVATSLYFGMAGVLPARMGEGLGGRLVVEAERIARTEGFERVILTTIEEMGNVGYYKRFGYRSVSVRELAVGYWGLTIPAHEHGMAKELPRIREARPDEAAAIATLVNLAYAVEDFFKVGDRTDEAEIASILERHRVFVVPGESGRLIASVNLSIEGAQGHFGMLSVDPDMKGQGLAKALVAHIEGFCLAHGCEYLDLEYVNLREELPDFYRRLGFEVTGEQPWPVEELHRISRPAHFVKMSKRLAPQGEAMHG